MRTAAEEKRICLQMARSYLNGESAVVTADSLARLLFEQRAAARLAGELDEVLAHHIAEEDDHV